MRVEIIDKGQAEVDLNAEVPISFAALDLIRRAETSPFAGPEVGPNQGGRLYAAQPITTGQGTVGAELEQQAADLEPYTQAINRPLARFKQALAESKRKGTRRR